MSVDDDFQAILDTLKLVVATLREAEVPFVLGGSLAAWARGAPQSYKDLDLMLRPADAERALAALARAGLRPERPPEEWLYKAWCGDVLVDLIFQPSGMDLDDAVFERAQDIPVMSVSTPVMAIEDVLVTKLMAMSEHSLNYTQLLGIARALREQIDWRELEQRTDSSPYAKAFFTLVRALDIAPAAGTAPERSPVAARVRVVSE